MSAGVWCPPLLCGEVIAKGWLESGTFHSSVVLDNTCLILEPDLLHVEEGPIPGLTIAQDLSARLL